MHHNRDWIKLVEKAQRGDKECLSRLAEAVRVRLEGYVYRLTLQQELTQDIVQEAILEMCKELHKLKRIDRFWSWLYAIAFNKVRSHYGKQWRRKTIPLSDAGRDIAAPSSPDGLAEMVADEWRQIIVKSMRELEPRHRAILAMRCYDRMPYSRIAEVMGCTELGAQALFYRAKKSLAKKLSRYGLGSRSTLTALVLFGKLTATSKEAAAGVSVTAAIVKVGSAASLVGMAVNKTTVVCLATAGVLSIGALVATSGPDKAAGAFEEKRPSTLQGTHQIEQANKAANEYWYFFPQGAGGPMMMRSMKGDAGNKRYYCQQMQDEQANYCFDMGKNVIYINNARLWHSNLSVWRLPTDNEKLREFLSQIENQGEQLEYVSSGRPALMTVVKRDKNGCSLWTTHHYHVLKEEYFRYSWPAEARVVDKRDAMHKRGWTYFKITGRVNGERVSGTGRIPFIYATGAQYRPWLRLTIGNRLRIVDSPSGALVHDSRGKVVAGYPAGSFFKGLGRPWMGLHTIDTVRRDAAEQRVWFETKYTPQEDKAEVVLTRDQSKLKYTIDMARDAIDKIAFSKSDAGAGELSFYYLQEIDEATADFTEPRNIRLYAGKRREPLGILWLIRLAEGDLASN